MNVCHRNQNAPQPHAQRAQAIVEFALVLPILMMLLVGIFEVGRMIYTYAAVTTASREAARYGSALGQDADYTGNPHKYKNCQGIRNSANHAVYFTPLTITITYDTGPSTSSIGTCNASTGEDGSVPVLDSGDRIRVEVKAHYKPLINLVPLPERDFTSISARTILGSVEVGSSTTGGGGGGGGGGGSSTSTPTSTPTPTGTSTSAPTSTNTPTPTATSPIIIATPTFMPTSTPTLIPTSTNTATPTGTATPTSTPTGTPTAASSCSTITAGNIVIPGNSNAISMTITNPYTDVTISSIGLTWNTAAGQSGPLTLDNANLVTALGTTYWSALNNGSGIATLTPSSTLTLPGNNKTSTITFAFVQNYNKQSMTGITVTINFSTPGCSALTKTSK